MQLSSEQFEPNGMIPAKYTCQGENISPPLALSSVPEQARSLVLICDDPDAATDPDGPGQTFDHWVMFNIPPGTAKVEGSVPVGALQGNNGAGALGYTGPCPPNGTHRYFFKLFALNQPLELDEGATKAQVEQAMEGAVLGQCQLVGRYQKS